MLSDIAEVEKEGDLEGRRQTIVLTGKQEKSMPNKKRDEVLLSVLA